MKDGIGAVDHFGDEMVVEDGVDCVVEAGPALEMGDVVDRPGGQIVQDEHLVPCLEQGFSQMRADEPGAACNQNSHDL